MTYSIHEREGRVDLKNHGFPFERFSCSACGPGLIKNWIYRLKGYRIGKGVSIGLGSVICGDQVEVGDHTSIGFLTIVRGKDIRIGAHVQIGSTTFLDTPHLQIGEGSKINEQVFIGGLQFPDSRFVLGRNCQIMQMSFINPSRSIVWETILASGAIASYSVTIRF